MAAEIIVTADDAGYCEGIDRAISNLAREGPLTRAAAFSNYATDTDSQNELTTNITVGLHYNLSSGVPVCPKSLVPTLTKADGRFYEPREYISQDFDDEQAVRDAIETFINKDFENYRVKDIRTELKHQLQQFKSVFGIPPDFGCVHHNLGRFDKVWQPLERLPSAPTPRMRQLEVGTISDVVSTFVQNSASVQDGIDRFRSMIVNAIRTGLETDTPIEIVCHPSTDTNRLDAFTVYTDGRVTEYKALQSSTISNIFDQGERVGDKWRFKEVPNIKDA